MAQSVGKVLALLLALVVLLSACAGDGGQDKSSREEDSQTGEVSRVEVPGGGPNLRELAVGRRADILSLSVLDTSLWGSASDYEMLLSVDAPVLMGIVWQAMEELRVDPDSRERLDGAPDLTGELLFLEISGGGSESDFWLQQLAVLPDGTAYFADMWREDGSSYHYADESVSGIHGWEEDVAFFRYRLADGEGYETLREAVEQAEARRMEEIGYVLEVFASPDWFVPESQVLRIQVYNTGDKPVTFREDFTLEYETADGWTALEYLGQDSGGTVSVAPGEFGQYILSLDDYRDSREPMNYRARGVFHYGEQSEEREIPYTVDPDSFNTSNPPKPEMDPDQQAYYDKYLSAWGFYSLFNRDYSPQNPPEEFNVYLLYQSSAFQEGVEDTGNSIELPADLVEGTITRHFPVTAEMVRANLPRTGDGERYDEATQTYHFPGGYGGGAHSGVVTGYALVGDLLTLECDWYGMDDSLAYSHRVTILLGEGEQEFLYQSNVVTNPGIYA